MDDRTEDLIARFDQAMCAFAEELDSGNSMVTQTRAESEYVNLLKIRCDCDVMTACQSSEFISGARRTLAAWGMNSRAAKLVPELELGDSLRENACALAEFGGLRLCDLSESEARKFAPAIWETLSRVRVGSQGTKIVANSKLGHFLLPDLIPPIDNAFTLWFLEYPSFPNSKEPAVFGEVLGRYARVISERRSEVTAALDKRWHSTPAKVVDNAVMGYKHLPAASMENIATTNPRERVR